jgi:hypothetical protein
MERRDKGEGAVGYVGIVSLVVVIAAALLSSGIGERFSGSVESAACRALQSDCPEAETPTTRPTPPKGPTVPCVQAPCPQPTPTPRQSGPRKPGGTIYCFRAPCPQPTPSSLPPSPGTG